MQGVMDKLMYCSSSSSRDSALLKHLSGKTCVQCSYCINFTCSLRDHCFTSYMNHSYWPQHPDSFFVSSCSTSLFAAHILKEVTVLESAPSGLQPMSHRSWSTVAKPFLNPTCGLSYFLCMHTAKAQNAILHKKYPFKRFFVTNCFSYTATV